MVERTTAVEATNLYNFEGHFYMQTLQKDETFRDMN